MANGINSGLATPNIMNAPENQAHTGASFGFIGSSIWILDILEPQIDMLLYF
jgi:hypothetical protein